MIHSAALMEKLLSEKFCFERKMITFERIFIAIRGWYHQIKWALCL